MSDQPAERSSRSVVYLPLTLGTCAILVSLAYWLQRSGSLFPHSLERFVQHHLDGIGITALGLAVTGIILGLYLGRGGRRNSVLLWGTLVSVAATLLQLLLPL